MDDNQSPDTFIYAVRQGLFQTKCLKGANYKRV